MALVGATGGFGGIEGSNSIARLLVVISGTSAPLSSALSSAEKSMSGFGAQASNIGSAMTRSVTLPLLAIGGASLAMAVQFESSLGRIAALTPILETTGKSIDEIGQELLDFSKTVPTSAVDLADALYFAGSAGLNAADAMDVVKLSAQGAAIGMGTAADISKVLIFAMNNYGSAAFDAGDAMDALTVAIKEGTAEPEEMAVALGRLLPVAKEAGVTFEEVVGSVAALTNVGFPARVATTSLRALFSELLSPTVAATEALTALGLTSTDVANQLKTGGPIAAFQLLEKATHGDAEALHDIIPQIRGFSAFLALTNNDMKSSKRIMEAVTNSTGALKDAFDVISQTSSFQFQVGLNKLKDAGIEIGQQLIPVFIKVASIIGDVGDAISGLPDFAKSGLADLILVGAAIGPLLKLYGTLTQVTKAQLAANAAGTRLVPTFKALSTGFLTAGIAAIAAYAGFSSLARGSTNLVSILSTSIGALVAAKLAITGLQLAVNAGAIGVNGLSLAFASMSGGTITAIAVAIGLVATGVGLLIGKANAAKAKTAELSGTLLDAASSGQTFKTAIDNINDEALKRAITDLAKAHGLLQVPVGQGFATAISAGATDLSSDLTGLVDKFGDAQAAAFATKHGIESLGGELGGYDQDFLNIAKAVQIATDKHISLGDAAKEVGVDINDVVGELNSLGSAGAGALSSVTDPLAAQIQTFQALAAANKDYQAEVLGSIAATASNNKAVQDYANQIGISTDYLSGRLQEFNFNVGAAGEEAKKAFEVAAFTSSKTGKTISASMAEAQAAVAETVSSINDSLSGGFTLFEKLDDKVKKSTAQLVGLAEAQSRSLLQEAANLKILAQRGVPADLIAKIAEQGPGVVEKFVNASKGQLRRLETAYAVGLGAVDDEILKEAAHQEVKGQNMVADFAQAMLSSSNLPVEAARRIVQTVTNEIAKGNLKPSALTLITTFVNSLGSLKNLSQKAGAKATDAFVHGIISGNIIDKAGHIVVRKLVQVLQTAGGLTKAQAHNLGERIGQGVKDGASSGNVIRQIRESGRQMGTSAADGVKDKKESVGQAGKSIARAGYENLNSEAPQFTDAGHLLGQKFADGLASTSGLAQTAAAQIAADAKAAFDASLKNSPEYFTYYMGKKLGADFQRGIDDASNIRGFRPKVNTRDVDRAAEPPKIVDDEIGVRRHLYEKQGVAAAEAFARGLVSGDSSDKAGRKIVSNLSGALRDGAQATRSEGTKLGSKMGDSIKQGVGQGNIVRAIRESGRTMGTSAAEGIRDKAGAVGDSGRAISRAGVATFGGSQAAYKQAGVSLGAAFASGLASATNLAQQAAARIANDARAAFDAALKNSPEFFTYYMGKKLAEDLQRGLDAGQPVKGFRPKVDTQDIDRATKPKLAGVPRKRHTTRAKPTVEQRKIHYINQPKARPVVEVRKVRYIDKPVPRTHAPHVPRPFRPKREVTPLVKSPSHRIAAPKHIDKPPAPKVDVRVPRPKTKPPAVPKPPSVNVVAKPVVKAAPPAHIAKPRRAPKAPTHHIAKVRRVPKPLTHHEPRKPRLVVEAPPIERKTKPPLVVKPVVNHIDKPRREPKAPSISRREAKPRHVVKPNVTHHVAKPPRQIEKTPSVKLTVQPPPAKETRGISHSDRPRHVETKGIHHRDRPQFLERERHHKRRDKTTLDVHIGREKFNRELNYSVRASGR